jgi:cystathionine gamma-synthase
MQYSTRAIHSDDLVEKFNSLAPPLHVSSTFVHDNDAKLVYNRSSKYYIHVFDQIDNHTRRRVEKVLGNLDNGFATSFTAGSSCIHSLIHFLKPTIIYVSNWDSFAIPVIKQYQSFVNRYSKNTSSPIQILDIKELDSIDISERNAKKSNKIVLIETPTFPTCKLYDIKLYAQISKQIGAYLVVDSTLATSVLQKPLSLGADFVIHNSTQFLGGHFDLSGGVIISKTPEIAEQIRKQRSVHGDVMGNMEAWLLLRSLRTLDLRVNRQSDSSATIAKWFESQMQENKIKLIWHPTLQNLHAIDFEIMNGQMSGKGPGILSFEMNSLQDADHLVQSVELITIAPAIGGVETTLHRLSPTLFVLGIGLESPSDIIQDLTQALKN